MEKYGKIIVLAGGPSSEREISLKSGSAVCEALRQKGQNADFFDVHTEDPEELRQLRADIVFIALHGKFGEDGSVQAVMEDLRLPYTGSGPDASRLAIDKIASREIFLKKGLKAPAYKVIKSAGDAEGIFGEFEAPFVVKPQREGSSIGLSIVSDSVHVKPAMNMAFSYGDTVIIEEYIHGREITVGILEERALPVIEIVTRHDVYDFDAKYVDEGTNYIVPAKLNRESYMKAQKCALSAHKALGCRDFSRVDMRMDAGGSIYVLEINTIPGLTERSLLPKAAKAAGFDFEDLCLRLVELAVKRR